MDSLTISDNSAPKQEERTLAELLFPTYAKELYPVLEQFRIKFEAEFGETDLTRKWTSTLPADEQNWLIKYHTKRYWDGLPPFLQAYMKERFHTAKRNGRLDDMPDTLLRLYLTQQMSISKGGLQR